MPVRGQAKKVICCLPSLFYWSAKLQKSLGYSHTRGLKTNNHTIINLLMEQMLSNDHILFFIAFLSRVRAFGFCPIDLPNLNASAHLRFLFANLRQYNGQYAVGHMSLNFVFVYVVGQGICLLKLSVAPLATHVVGIVLLLL